jgi:hypothetical protein
MTQKIDFEQMWQDTRNHLAKLSRDTMDLLKKGEKEVVMASGKAKVNFEIMLLKAKKEQLYYLIGKESVKRGKSAKADRLIKEVEDLNKNITANKKLLRKFK